MRAKRDISIPHRRSRMTRKAESAKHEGAMRAHPLPTEGEKIFRASRGQIGTSHLYSLPSTSAVAVPLQNSSRQRWLQGRGKFSDPVRGGNFSDPVRDMDCNSNTDTTYAISFPSTHYFKQKILFTHTAE